MVDYEKEFRSPDYQMHSPALQVGAVFRRVYGWMALGLAVSGVIAWYTAASGLWQKVLVGPGIIGCIVAELALVIGLSSMIRKLSPLAAAAMFLAYAAVNGLTLSVVFIAYELAAVQKVFFITAGMFAGLALWGTFTKNDLSSIGSVCMMAIWGLIIAGVVNIFLGSSQLEFICSFIGILVFSGLTMYDAQKIKMMAAQEGTLDGSAVSKLAVIGALELYLDFVNLFLHILRFFGRKN